MPIARVAGPDNKVYRIQVPDSFVELDPEAQKTQLQQIMPSLISKATQDDSFPVQKTVPDLKPTDNVIEDEDEEVEFEGTKFSQLKDKIKESIESMTARELGVLRMRMGMPDGINRTLEEVGNAFEVTRERIRQIEAKSIRKMSSPLKVRRVESFLESA